MRAGGRFGWSSTGGWGVGTNIWMAQFFKMVVWRGEAWWWLADGPIAESGRKVRMRAGVRAGGRLG